MKRSHLKSHIHRWLYCCLLIFSILFLSACDKFTTNISYAQSNRADENISLIIAGDAMHHMPQMYAAYEHNTGNLNYSLGLQHIKPIVESSDLAVCNLETPLAGKPYTGYPQFSAPDEFFYALQDCGFDVFLLANNHVYDKGSKGFERTDSILNLSGVHSVGAYKNDNHREANYPLILNINSVKIAFLNFTYGTNGIRVNSPNIVNAIDTVQIVEDIKKAKEEGTDIIIALPHWGEEYKLSANKSQKSLASFLISHGVDLIVGSHPHVVQEVDLLTNNSRITPVFYSLGNFTSNQRQKHQNGGIMAKVYISKRDKIITSVSFIPFYLYKGYLNKQNNFYLIPTLDFYNNPNKYPIPASDKWALTEHHLAVRERIRNIRME